MDTVIAEARGHLIQTVAVVKADRWARSVQHIATSVADLHELSAEFFAVDQGLRVDRDPNGPTATLILRILGSVAEGEASDVSRECTKETLGTLGARTKRGFDLCRRTGKSRKVQVRGGRFRIVAQLRASRDPHIPRLT